MTHLDKLKQIIQEMTAEEFFENFIALNDMAYCDIKCPHRKKDCDECMLDSLEADADSEPCSVGFERINKEF